MRNTVIVPASISSFNINKEQIPGWTRGWDVRTGKLKWTFHTVPRPGEFGNDTWEDDSWAYTGKVSGWSIYSADEELGYVYLPLNTAAPDYYGGHRLGDGLFGESLVCLDVETGKRVWHYQFVHHGLWDYDPPAAPNLLDVTVNGQRIKAVAQVTKQGFVFTFDRVTGQPIWPIEERPVPPSDVPGERAARTQPFPTKPAPFEYQGFTEDRPRRLHAGDPRDGAGSGRRASGWGRSTRRRRSATPANRGHARQPRAQAAAPTGRARRSIRKRACCTCSRGTRSRCSGSSRRARTTRATCGSWRGAAAAAADAAGAAALQAAVFAHDRDQHEHRRSRVDGAARRRRCVREHPMLKGLNLPPLGGDSSMSGPLLTKTLLIGALTRGGTKGGPRLVARDKATGSEVASIDLPGVAIGTPMTYMIDGKQYIALTVAATPVPELVAYALAVRTQR